MANKKNKIPLSQSELKKKLQTHLRYLDASCQAYDQGDQEEAQRIAIQLRILLHDTKHSKSLLGQLNMKNSFLDTSFKVKPHIVRYGEVEVDEGRRLFAIASRLKPLLNTSPESKRISFDKWWTEPILRDKDGIDYSRQTLITNMSDTDGGAHVDSELHEDYYKLTRTHSLHYYVFVVANEDFSKKEPIPLDAAGVTIRQIGHEVLKTVLVQYNYDGEKYYPGAHMLGMSIEISKGDQ